MPRCRACKRETNDLRTHRQLCWDCDTLRRLINKQPDIAGIMLRQWRRKHGLTTGAGRPETVGRFKNRKDFEDRIMFLWTTTEMTQTQIAEDVQCSVHAVRRVLRKVREEEERGDRKKWDWYV